MNKQRFAITVNGKNEKPVIKLCFFLIVMFLLFYFSHILFKQNRRTPGEEHKLHSDLVKNDSRSFRMKMKKHSFHILTPENSEKNYK